MKNIYDYTLCDLEEYFISIGEKKFKATQVYEWIYKKRITDFSLMSNVSKKTIESLKRDFTFDMISVLSTLKGNGVEKYLFQLNDKNKVEAVLMYHDYGNSLCISTEVGCNMGCAFCESGRLKKVRNLEVNEMVMQILKIEEITKKRISHIVLMGIGEPFDNYGNVIKFLEIVNCGKGIDIGARHITVSTCGIIPKIERFIDDGRQVNLAISLHAPNNEIRNAIMPINKVYPIEKLIDVLKKYIEKTNRRVTFEYILLKGINDFEEHAFQLARILKGMNAYVNLIPYNETSHIQYKRSSNEKILKFYDILKKNRIQVTIRKEFREVMAACGQLRSNYEEEL